MKKSLILILIIFCSALVVSVLVAGSCDNEQTIMKLYSESNSHGALWNQKLYPLCIFGANDGQDFSVSSSSTGGIYAIQDEKIVSLDSDCNFIEELSLTAMSLPKITEPVDLTFGLNERLYAINRATKAIVEILVDVPGTSNMVTRSGIGLGYLNNPVAVQFTQKVGTSLGEPWMISLDINEIGRKDIVVFNSRFKFLKRFEVQGLENPAGMIIHCTRRDDMSGECNEEFLYLADKGANLESSEDDKIIKLDLNGNIIDGDFLSEDKRWDNIQDISIKGDNILVMDNDEILEYSFDGMFINSDRNNFFINICYNDLFGYEFLGLDKHPVSCSFPVLYLSSEANAHASSVQSPAYNIPVCFSDLECSVANSCSAGSECVVTISDTTNAHLAVCNLDESYTKKICCSQETVAGNLHWENMDKIAIDKANLSDMVRLAVPGFGLSGEIEYEVYKDVFLWFDKKISAQSSSLGYATWRAGVKSDGSLEKGVYYFKAKIDGEWITSKDEIKGKLTVFDSDNKPPVAQISSPNDRDVFIFAGNEQLKLTQTSFDEDDEFSYVWDIGGVKYSGNSINKENWEVLHTFGSTGQKNIILTVTDSRGLMSKTRISILFIGSNYSFAFVSKPESSSSIDNSIIDFDATGSFALSYTSSGDVLCLVGDCPSETKGSNIKTIVDPNGNIDNYAGMTFEWTLDIGGFEINKQGQSFSHPFGHPGEHLSTLKTSFEDSLSGTTLFWFTNQLKNRCANSGKTWWDINQNAHNTLVELGSCVGFDGEAGTNDDCCPSGYSCIGDEYEEVCQIVEECKNVFSCSDYKDSVDCGKDACSKGKAGTGEGTSRCGNLIIPDSSCNTAFGGLEWASSFELGCSCKWSDEKECYQNEEISLRTENQIISGYCEKEITTEGCIDGVLDVNVASLMNWNSDLPSGIDFDALSECGKSLCSSESYEAVCGGPVVKLPFFTLINFILAGILILLFYTKRYFWKK